MTTLNELKARRSELRNSLPFGGRIPEYNQKNKETAKEQVEAIEALTKKISKIERLQGEWNTFMSSKTLWAATFNMKYSSTEKKEAVGFNLVFSTGRFNDFDKGFTGSQHIDLIGKIGSCLNR